MIQFDNWRIWSDQKILAPQFDHMTCLLAVAGDLPAGWTWEMLVSAGEDLDILPLSPDDTGGVSALLTAEHLSRCGVYTLQLRGRRGEEVRHSNPLPILVPESLSGDKHWPALPTEFSQAESRIAAYNAHPPVPGPGGYWRLWNVETGAYEDSDLPLPGGGGGFPYQLGSSLKITGVNTLEVNTADAPEADNTLPITAAAVHTTVGNIDALLQTI